MPQGRRGMEATAVTETMHAYVMRSPGEPLVREQRPMPEPGPGEVLLEVLGCGLCHTDFGYLREGVPTRKAPPLVLGHEVVGRVVARGEGVDLPQGQAVVVPAVLPCGDCDWCRAGRANACPRQQMLGNDVDGGFASHVVVRAAPLVPVDAARWGERLPLLSVVADAVSTAWQALRRAEVGEGDLVVVVGSGGVGSFLAQLGAALGAHVLALDVRAEAIARLQRLGCLVEGRVLDDAVDGRSLRKWLRAKARELGVPSLRWRLFEASGHPAGQRLFWTLLDRSATGVVVGYSPRRIEVRLANLMAFDATVHGSWGCPPAAYPEVLRLIEEGKVALEPFVRRAPMSRLNEWMDAMGRGELTHRLVLDPQA